MNHPHDDLTPYMLGELDDPERARLEAHLASCGACQRELESMERTFVAMVEELPSQTPPPHVWDAIAARTGVQATSPHVRVEPPAPSRRTARPMWGALAMAAAVAIAATGVLWGWEQRQSYLDLRAEQAQITRWLTRPDIQARTFASADGAYGGTVLFQPDGRALVVMRSDAPPRRSYQAWGIGADGAVSLGVLEDRTLEISAEGFQQIAVSLEPPGGSPTGLPTGPVVYTGPVVGVDR